MKKIIKHGEKPLSRFRIENRKKNGVKKDETRHSNTQMPLCRKAFASFNEG